MLGPFVCERNSPPPTPTPHPTHPPTHSRSGPRSRQGSATGPPVRKLVVAAAPAPLYGDEDDGVYDNSGVNFNYDANSITSDPLYDNRSDGDSRSVRSQIRHQGISECAGGRRRRWRWR